jgi:hypothetical protein
MATSMKLIVAALLLAPISATITWDSTYGKDHDRRLEDNLKLAFSHDAADCVVAGVDPDHPTTIYIGGPCQELVNGVPTKDFRWIEMQTFDADLVDKQGSPAEMVPLQGEEFSYQHEESAYAEAGAGMSVGFDTTGHPGMENAGLFLSTTSYLAKDTFQVTTNDFVVGKGANDRVENVCIVPCTGGSYPVACSTCPNTPLSVTPGMYKYSILAAAYDGARDSVANGWSKVKAAYGDPTKGLEGFLNVYQGIDFTNMKADTLTITGPSGSATTYASMSACSMSTWKDVADPSKDCVAYDVASATVQSDGWQGSYAFPLTYNYGTWTQTIPATGKITTAIEGTHKVKIQCIKPSAADLKNMKMEGKKLVLLEYQFDVSGIDAGVTAEKMMGAYMVYDPTITTKGSGSSSGSSGSGAGAGGSSGAKSKTTAAPDATSSAHRTTALSVAMTMLAYIASHN